MLLKAFITIYSTLLNQWLNVAYMAVWWREVLTELNCLFMVRLYIPIVSHPMPICGTSVCQSTVCYLEHNNFTSCEGLLCQNPQL